MNFDEAIKRVIAGKGVWCLSKYFTYGDVNTKSSYELWIRMRLHGRRVDDEALLEIESREKRSGRGGG
jgi:hypothetical protein